MKILNIEISKIRQHEEVDKEHLNGLMEKIRVSGFFREPIIVDSSSLIVLDGHHRLNSCKLLGLKKIPCIMVDYLGDERIRVVTRRKGIPITKDIVVSRGLKNLVFPKKTTKHFIPYRVKNLRIPLKQLL